MFNSDMLYGCSFGTYLRIASAITGRTFSYERHYTASDLLNSHVPPELVQDIINLANRVERFKDRIFKEIKKDPRRIDELRANGSLLVLATT